VRRMITISEPLPVKENTQLCIYVLFYRKWLWYCYHSSHWWQLCIYERLRNRSGSTNMPGYIRWQIWYIQKNL
jgi:hypothetical protein